MWNQITTSEFISGLIRMTEHILTSLIDKIYIDRMLRTSWLGEILDKLTASANGYFQIQKEKTWIN